jgi:hypothetical protein
VPVYLIRLLLILKAVPLTVLSVIGYLTLFTFVASTLWLTFVTKEFFQRLDFTARTAFSHLVPVPPEPEVSRPALPAGGLADGGLCRGGPTLGGFGACGWLVSPGFWVGVVDELGFCGVGSIRAVAGSASGKPSSSRIDLSSSSSGMMIPAPT